MLKKIENIVSSVKYGPHLVSKPSGSIKYIKGNHINDDYQLEDITGSFALEDDKAKKNLLKKDDVILAAKGYRNPAWAYEEKHGKCIPSSIFYVIQTPAEVLSKYLAIYMNSPKFQFQLKQIGLGVSIPSIPKNELLKLKIFVPSIKEQKRIIQMNALLTQEIELEKQMLQQRRNLKKGLINLLTSKHK